MAFYELRQYKVRPGKMAEWLKVMEEEIIPFFPCGGFGTASPPEKMHDGVRMD